MVLRAIEVQLAAMESTKLSSVSKQYIVLSFCFYRELSSSFIQWASVSSRKLASRHDLVAHGLLTAVLIALTAKILTTKVIRT